MVFFKMLILVVIFDIYLFLTVYYSWKVVDCMKPCPSLQSQAQCSAFVIKHCKAPGIMLFSPLVARFFCCKITMNLLYRELILNLQGHQQNGALLNLPNIIGSCLTQRGLLCFLKRAKTQFILKIIQYQPKFKILVQI